VGYLGRYTHKVAISNHRIEKVTEQSTFFRYKDYKNGGKTKPMELTNGEFVRRFSMHILPKRFVRIRHYGILSSTWKRKKLPDLRQQLKVKSIVRELKLRLRKCPCCKTGNLIMIETFGERGPPAEYLMENQPNTR